MDSDMDMMVESFDGTESDDERLLMPLGESFDALRGALLTKDKTQVLTALKILRKNSSEREGTIYHSQGMTAASRLTNEVVYLFKIGDQDIQDNASWVLVNISAGSLEQAKTIFDAGAIPLMVDKLKARSEWQGHQETELNIVWCFMNLATDREEYGKVLIAHGILELLIGMVEKVPPSHLLLTTIAALAALQAEIPWDITCKRLPDVLKYIQFPNDKDELDDACRSLDYMLKRYNRQNLKIPESVMSKVPFLVRYLTHSYRHVQRSSRGVLDTIASGSDQESQALLDAGILDVLNRFLNNPNMCANACKTISKLTAGNAPQIQQVIDSGAMLKVVRILSNLDYDIVKWKEAAWAVANALDIRHTLEQFTRIVKMGSLEALCKVIAQYNQDFAQRGDNSTLKTETTHRILRSLDRATIDLPKVRDQVEKAPQLVAMIEEVFSLDGYRTYQRESKMAVTSPDPGSDFEQRLALAMKRFTLDDDDPDVALTSKLSSVRIKENENPPPRSPFFFQFPPKSP